jgi:hypothetical protein
LFNCTFTSLIASKLIVPLKICGLPRSLPTSPSTVTVFQELRLPLMFGLVVPKLPPGASLSPWYDTPGSTRSSDMTSRPRTATSSSCVAVMSAERSELVVCTKLPSAVVVTVSVSAPTVMVTVPSDKRSLAGRVMFFRSTVLKPAISIRTV